jgi:sugar/nucleoside kinase (ribokinase family)
MITGCESDMSPNRSYKPFDVITFGDMCVDLIVTGDDVVPEFGQVEKLVGDYELEMGGSCNIFACQAARLGLRVGILGRVGDDDYGRLILRRLQESGVDTRFVMIDPALKTGLGIALCTGHDRAILTYMGSLNAVYPADVSDEILRLSHHVHHGSYFLHTNLRPAMTDIFQRALAFGATTSLDTNWDPDESWNDGLQNLLPLVDIFFPNEQEARLTSGCASLDEALANFKNMGIHITTVKLGKEGAVLASGKQRLTQKLPPVTGGDSIGAGDSFDAGFLAGWLRELPLDDCLRIASHCGREVASQVGGLRGQPDWEAIVRLANID